MRADDTADPPPTAPDRRQTCSTAFVDGGLPFEVRQDVVLDRPKPTVEEAPAPGSHECSSCGNHWSLCTCKGGPHGD